MNRAPLERGTVLLVGVLAFGMGLAVYLLGFSQKWVGAVTATVLPFGMVVAAFPKYWRARWFWVTMILALAIHVLLSWWVVGVILGRTEIIPFVISISIATAEGGLLVVLVGVVARRLRRRFHPTRNVHA